MCTFVYVHMAICRHLICTCFFAQVSRTLNASHYAVILEIYFCQRMVVFVGYLVIMCQLQLFSTGLLSTYYTGSSVLD